MDMSDYVSILKGDKRIQMTLGGQNQEEMDLEFLFIVGTPPRDVVQYEQIWQGTNRIGIANINQIIADTKLAPTSLPLSTDASTFKLKSSITGHGSEGEFGQNGGIINHKISIDDVETFDWIITQECSLNPIFPQGGTWVFDRQGWCPGERTLMKEHDLTPHVTAGGSLNIDYNTSNPPLLTGDYRYHIAHQVVGYGDANFQQDAAVVGIIAPNNSAEFTRVGTICANPSVMIRNTGATQLTQLTINYWLNDTPTPQTFEWTGSLDFMEEEVVTIPTTAALWYDLTGTDNVFHVEIANPNQGTDEYNYNNTMSSTFNVPDVLPYDMTIEFRTNNNPSENRYDLYDDAGELIGSNSLPIGPLTYNDDYTLESKCYTLVVTDTGGDGVQWWANPNQGVGFIRIRNSGGNIIREFEPDFGGGFEFNFTTDFPISTEEIEFVTSLKVYPNPANYICTLEGKDLSKTNVHLTNLLGQSISAPVISRSDNAISFDVQNLDSGVYFIVIQKGEVVTTRKIVVD